MKYFRIVLIHLILVAFIIFISFGSVYIIENSPEAQKTLSLIKKDWNLEQLIRQAITLFINCILVIYTFYFAIFNLLLRKRPGWRNILYSTGIIILLIIINLIISTEKCNLSQVSNYLVFICFMGILGVGARAIIEYFKTKEKQKELESKNLKIELDLLRSQLNPHFLFNTLNNIDALIRKDPERASELLIKLSQEMRYMLYDSNTDKISLSSEVDFIKDYVSLQRLRIKNPDAIQLNLEGNFENIMLPPMLLLPFIENAFKYCNKFDIEKAIVISLTVDNKELIFESSNYFDPENKTHNVKAGGIGLEVVEKRLDLLFPNKHMFRIKEIGNQFIVSLKIKFDGN